MRDIPAASLRADLRRWLGLREPVSGPAFETLGVASCDGFDRIRATFASRDGAPVPAYLLVPHGLRAPAPGLVVHHQHNGERHLGKSEVSGLAGDPLQAFGPALAARGFVVLAPDSICFEDRRASGRGIEPHPADGSDHYNAMCHRLLVGDTLMRTVLEDAETAYSALASHPAVDARRVGVMGHSYGGSTALFQAALDERVAFACSSGAACSFRDRIARGTGIEMAQVLPGAASQFDIEDLVRLAAPRPLVIASATDDVYSHDADEIVRLAAPACAAAGASAALRHLRYVGGHALTPARAVELIDAVAAVRLGS